MVQAKFKVVSVTESEGWYGMEGNLKTVKLQPVYDPDPESVNGKFYAATPSGSIDIGTMNASAAAEFEIGKEYLVSFEKV